jgi:hypothetical protein
MINGPDVQPQCKCKIGQSQAHVALHGVLRLAEIHPEQM